MARCRGGWCWRSWGPPSVCEHCSRCGSVNTRRREKQEQCSHLVIADLAYWSHADRQGRPRAGASRDHAEILRRRTRPAGDGRRRRAVAARRGPRARHGVVGGVPLRRQPRRAADAADHRGLRRPRRRRRGGGRAVTGTSPAARFVAAGRAVRTWAVDNPHQYALLYGSPVPGYEAPQDTIGPASRATLALVGIVADAHRDGVLRPPAAVPARSSAPLRRDLAAIRDARGRRPARRGARGDDRRRGRSCSAWCRSSCSARPATSILRARRAVRRHAGDDGGDHRPVVRASATGRP